MDAEVGRSYRGFTEKSIRLAFIRKVYAILFAQLLVTVGMISVFLYWAPLREWLEKRPLIVFIPLGATIVLGIVIVCYQEARRRYPLNIILLTLFTLCEGFLVGFICVGYQVREVYLAAGTCTGMALLLTIFAMQTKIDFTKWLGIMVVVLFGLIAFAIIRIFFPVFGGRTLHLAVAIIGAIVFGIFIIIDTQMMLGGKHKYNIDPEDYVFAALNLYMDIINLFLYLLQIFGNRN